MIFDSGVMRQFFTISLLFGLTFLSACSDEEEKIAGLALGECATCFDLKGSRAMICNAGNGKFSIGVGDELAGVFIDELGDLTADEFINEICQGQRPFGIEME